MLKNKLAISILAACSSLLLLSYSANSAQVLKWVDDNGKVHYGDVSSQQGQGQVIELNISSYESVSIIQSEAIKGDRVVMYSTDWCGYCKQARRYFEKNDIDFVEYDIEKNRTARRAYKKLGAKGVPIILVGKQRMNGFSVAGFNRIYKQVN
ncbi:MAG: DUF4124 domain-containing protein [Gammaproteobacteria bacterium]|nr:DUF4124 domain-containing protein [Gammaproteobacteria bacterium]